MDTPWPTQLGLGDRVRFDGWVHTVVALHGGLIELSDPYGAVRQVDLVQLVSSRGFAVVDAAPVPSAQAALRVPSLAAERARCWERHIVEVVTGLPPDAEPGTVPRPQYDPATFPLANREEAKAAELQQMGFEGVSARTVRRKRHRWQAEGINGLVDGRSSHRPLIDTRPTAHVEVLQALQQLVAETRGTDRSVAFYWRSTAQLLEEWGLSAEAVMPSRAGFYRLYARAAEAGVLDSRAQLETPDRWTRPGERVHVTTVHLAPADWLPGCPLAVTLAVDEASHSILDAVVHPVSSRVDGAAMVARICTPASLRPRPSLTSDGRAALREAANVPTAGLNAVARPCGPVVRPETLVLDYSSMARMDACRRACQELKINIRQARSCHPAAVSFLERIARRVITELADWFRLASGTPTPQVQELLETWVGEVWQNTPRVRREGPLDSRPAITPNQAHAAAVAAAGRTAMPLSPSEFLGFLPQTRRAVGSSGLRINSRRYDSTDLDRLRNTTADKRSQPRFVVRWDPCDVRYVWVTGPSGWITVPLASVQGIGNSASAASPTAVPVRDELGGDSVVESTVEAAPGSSGVTLALDLGTAARNAQPPVVRWQRMVAGSQSLSRPGSRTGASLSSSDLDRVRYHAGLLLPAPSVLSAVRQAERLVALNRGTGVGKRGLVVSGDHGTGKTTALIEVASVFEDRHKDLQRVRSDSSAVVPTVYISVPPGATARDLLSEFLGFFGLPRPKRVASYDLARQVGNALTAADTEVVLIDDCHRLRAAPASSAPTAEFLRYLSQQAPSTFVFAGTGPRPSLMATLAPQPARSDLLEAELTDMACDSRWDAFVAEVEQRLLLHSHELGTLPALSEYLHHLTSGSLDRLTYLVRSGAIHAIRSGQEAITEPDLAALSTSWPRSHSVDAGRMSQVPSASREDSFSIPGPGSVRHSRI